MKEYVISTLEKSKGSAYYLFRKNVDLLGILDTKYPHLSDLIVKIQLYIRDLDDVPNCKFSGCNNKVAYHTPNFADTCSAFCRAEYMKESGIYKDNAKKVSKNIKNKSDEEKSKIREKTLKTNKEKYGTDHPMKNENVKKKHKDTVIKNHGVDHFMKSEKIKEKQKRTNLERYGVGYYMQANEFKSSAKQTNLEKYGVENPSQNPEIIEKIKQTNLEKYGTESYSHTDEFKDRVKNTNLEKYGVEYPMLNEDVKNKQKQTNLEKYGVDHHTKTDERKELNKQQNVERYGVEHYYQSDEFKEKAKQTNLEKYGVENVTQNPEIVERIKQTNLEKYGVTSYSRNHFNSDYKNIFDNKEEFEKLLYEHGTYKLADIINCNVSTVYEFANKNSIILPPRPRSHQEEIVLDFLTENNIIFTTNNKKILPSGKELDFYFPEQNLAIEINGLYWHSQISGGKDRRYHHDKWKECDDLGITLLSIMEDEFAEKPHFWFNKILYMTGKLSLTKIHARKCEVREMDTVSEFLNNHHIQGSNTSKYKLGLFYENILVSVMTFSNTRNNESKVIDLSRFCNHSGYSVSGGASKLLSYFVKTYGHLYEKIISFSDNNYSNGNVYNTLGFDLVDDLSPDYKYIIDGKRYHKAGFRKDAIFSKFDISEDMKNATEWELMQYLGYDRIWDTGKRKWEMKI
jgi:hypothetical protein